MTAAQKGWLRAGLIVAAAGGLCWPAFWNGQPVVMPDSLEYLADGRTIWKAIIGRHLTAHASFGRPEGYSFVIFPFHLNRSMWPVIALQALVTAWVLWLIVRTAGLRRVEVAYAAILAVLCLCTSACWCVSRLMPDILGPLLYLAVVLLVFQWDKLSKPELVGVALLACWGVVAHLSHLTVVIALCGFLGLLWLVRWSALRGKGRQLLVLYSVVVFAILSQTALHRRMYGRASLGGARPVYQMARITADGTGRNYLRTHCNSLNWTICRYQNLMDASDTTFLWMPGGVWQKASETDRLAFRSEEVPLVLATLRTYPMEQARISLKSYIMQLKYFVLDDIYNYWTGALIDRALPNGQRAYMDTRQARNVLPEAFLTKTHYAAVEVSLVLILLLLAGAWRLQRLRGLVVVIFFVVLFNAAVTAVLSGVFGRYQSRVVWLFVLLAGILVAERLEREGIRFAASGEANAVEQEAQR